jgi:hypothetical protein
MTRLVFAMGRHLELYMWNRELFMSASDWEMVGYATRHVVKALAEAPHWQLIETFKNTAMQQNNIWSIAFKAHTKENLKEVCQIHGPHWILHAQTCTRFTYKSIRFQSHLIQSARNNIADRYDLHRFESAAERLQFLDSFLAENKYLFPVAECVEGRVCGPNSMQRELKTDNKWLASTSLPRGSNPAVYLHNISSSGD